MVVRPSPIELEAASGAPLVPLLFPPWKSGMEQCVCVVMRVATSMSILVALQESQAMIVFSCDCVGPVQ